MYTITWFREAERYRLFCNRDELRTRAVATAPRRHRRDGVQYLSPIDGESGGTWIAANEHGLTLCLLNDYGSPPPEHRGDLVSRGRLIEALASAPDFQTVTERWDGYVLSRHRPFKLLVLQPDRPTALLHWDGRNPTLRARDIAPPVTSSSFDDRRAETVRQRLLASFLDEGDAPIDKMLMAFHRSHLPERGPFSVCMHRPDALTVSFSLVEVDAESVALSYASGPPCSTDFETVVTLQRARGAAPTS